jgi:hypothetical protein
MGSSNVQIERRRLEGYLIRVDTNKIKTTQTSLQPFAELRARLDFFFQNSPDFGSDSNLLVAHSFLLVLLQDIYITRPLDMFYELVVSKPSKVKFLK